MIGNSKKLREKLGLIADHVDALAAELRAKCKEIHDRLDTLSDNAADPNEKAVVDALESEWKRLRQRDAPAAEGSGKGRTKAQEALLQCAPLEVAIHGLGVLSELAPHVRDDEGPTSAVRRLVRERDEAIGWKNNTTAQLLARLRAAADNLEQVFTMEGSPEVGMTLRPEVAAFAREMERQLRANDHKPGWRDDTADSLLERLREETNELAHALDLGRGDIIIKEAADVANFAMMVADVCDGRREVDDDED